MHGHAALVRRVLDRHLRCFAAGDLEGTLADYAPEAALLTLDGPLRGTGAIREFFARIFAEFAQPGTTAAIRQVAVEGDCAFVCWDADTAEHKYKAASDTFVIRNGKITVQTFCAKITAKRAGSGSRLSPAG